MEDHDFSVVPNLPIDLSLPDRKGVVICPNCAHHQHVSINQTICQWCGQHIVMSSVTHSDDMFIEQAYPQNSRDTDDQ